MVVVMDCIEKCSFKLGQGKCTCGSCFCPSKSTNRWQPDKDIRVKSGGLSVTETEVKCQHWKGVHVSCSSSSEELVLKTFHVAHEDPLVLSMWNFHFKGVLRIDQEKYTHLIACVTLSHCVDWAMSWVTNLFVFVPKFCRSDVFALCCWDISFKQI